mgnify:FL=1
MKTVKMSYKDFGQYLLKVPFGKTINFALDYEGPSYEDELPYGTIVEEGFDCNCWYFIKGIEVTEYLSRFWLCDYAGGEEAFAIPVYGCSYPKYPCEEDRTYIPEYWDICWKQICDRHGGFQDYLFVEIDEEDEV